MPEMHDLHVGVAVTGVVLYGSVRRGAAAAVAEIFTFHGSQLCHCFKSTYVGRR